MDTSSPATAKGFALGDKIALDEDVTVLDTYARLLDEFDPAFPIVTPWPPNRDSGRVSWPIIRQLGLGDLDHVRGFPCPSAKSVGDDGGHIDGFRAHVPGDPVVYTPRCDTEVVRAARGRCCRAIAERTGY
jgi:hypothetical protein